MNEIERRISAFLHQEADGANPSNEMYQRVLRRAKPRRILTATVAGVAAVSIVVAGVVTAGALRSPSIRPPVGPPSESATPEDQEEGSQTVVGQGTVSGRTWTLVAYESASGLCVDLEVGSGGSGGGCGFDVPAKRDLGLNVGSQGGLSKTIIHGVVSKRVVTLRVTLSDGERIHVDTIEGPVGFKVNFFVGFLPPNAEGAIEAIGRQGALLQTQRIRPLPDPRDETVFTEEVLDDHKLVVYYPRGWQRGSDALVSGLSQRTELLSLGTYPLAPGHQGCANLPEAAIEDLGPSDAFITLQETSSPGHFPNRPNAFSRADGEIPAETECLDNGKEIFFRMFRFRDEGRTFFAYVALGTSAPAQTRNELWQILNSLMFCDPESPPNDCL